MKARILLILFSKLLMDFSSAVNAQQLESSPSAMKDSFPAFVSKSDDGMLADSGNEISFLNSESTSRDYLSPDAFVIISKMTTQVRTDIESKRVRVVNSDDQDSKTKKQAGKKSKKEKVQQ